MNNSKTTFLLQYAKEKFAEGDRSCLYVNTNNFYIQTIGLTAFADEFYHTGGKVLLVDQAFKLTDWSKQMRECHDKYPGLKIVFTTSSVDHIGEYDELKGIVNTYNLRGFSFREYLNLKSGLNFGHHSLDDIIENHEKIAAEIVEKTDPYKYFNDYLHH